MLRIRSLGSVPYHEAYTLQHALARAADDYLLVLEHPHTYTLGAHADRRHVLVDPARVGAVLVQVLMIVFTEAIGNALSAAGRMMGELGFVDPKNRRTQTVECVEDGDVLAITYEKLLELYFQNPEFGYYFLRLTTERLMQNISRLEGIIEANKKDIARLEGLVAARKVASQ